jgi:ATP synthase protein I
MSRDPLQEPLNDLDDRLRRLREESEARQPQGDGGRTASGYGLAFMLATDMLAGLIGGGLLGWAVDSWLGTSPWGLIGFFFLGATVGMWNVYRTASARTAAAAPRRSAGGTE